MSLSLIGIIIVQVYWILNSIESKDEQFSLAVTQSLISVARELENSEYEIYYDALRELEDSLGKDTDPATLRKILLKQRRKRVSTNARLSNNPLSENTKLDPQFENIEIDSVFPNRANKINRSEISQIKSPGNTNTESRFARLLERDNYARKVTGESVSEYNSMLPITQRISSTLVRNLISQELEKRPIINSQFEFAIYQDGFATRIQSDNFQYVDGGTWSYPVLRSNNSNVEPYYLYLSLPDRKKEILSSVTGMALLSLIFTTVIIIAYSNAINQIFKQRQISQIKTDFINNMTHEFKTPIATINLALDSLKHPKINSDPEKVQNYLRMIREENKRMHSQVENVLRISKLEKNNLNIEKTRLEMNTVIEDSITHIQLLLEEKGGIIKSHLGALRTDVLGNESHLTNVIVNVLENAIKYTEDAPIIDVYTENVKNKLVIKIRDQGIGMTKSAQKKAFQKFFREHTGDIHNVKGHGLGLAYSKRILEDHNGDIFVQSSKGNGSTFSIHLPLIV
ncbi:sensor histidine kinase [Nonlabens ponticola]|uniref:histidine kinase n=1 Tax=Nonlabens ponticola TaxID=2496866 RepID=A0A3S9MY06_9FLAO|nr:HAMP domain-containing sensor histidine kinase [Nonlabens ponticola]AZQ44024.1 HAMP domain-containing histidine kinase [Nonlabens ponticola]